MSRKKDEETHFNLYIFVNYLGVSLLKLGPQGIHTASSRIIDYLFGSSTISTLLPSLPYPHLLVVSYIKSSIKPLSLVLGKEIAMATTIPGWTIRPTEWAVLRDQIAATSKPTLSYSIRASSFILIGLCSISIFVHLCSLWLRLRNRTSSSRRLFDSTILGYHQPDLTLIFPIIFLIHAILNVASLSSLLSDANQLKFKGYTMAIQQFNFSFLMAAGILLTWALVCGLPPLRIGLCGGPRNRWGQPSIPPIHSKIKPSWLHSIAYSSLVVVFLIPLPCIILSMKAIEDINILDSQLLETFNHVLESDAQPAGDVITNALQTIGKLDQTSSFLFTHIRMLSALHLFLTFAILAGCLWVSLEIIRKLMAHLTEPKPALIVKSNGNLPAHPSIDQTTHDKDFDLEGFGNKAAFPNANPTDSFASETYLVPSVDSDHHQGPQSETQQAESLQNYIKKLKFILILVGTCASGFMVLNFCIMTNSFKYPDDISIGDLLILKLEWSTWLWNGSISPLIGLANCLIMLSKGRATKKLTIW
ncbi:hypothetical protein KEM48_010575 [Puccinia striiformis f. sp. tritici PST-130]|nr:hypothetical protein KEM48_010575 [Puccinia striiformis f. sp. tritici PST-130]